jgi:hypothetical protein
VNKSQPVTSTRLPSFNVPVNVHSDTPRSLYEVPGIAPVGIGILGEDRSVCSPHGLLSLVPFPVNVIASRGLEDSIVRHHRHQQVDIMTIPGIGECRQQFLKVAIRRLHRLG